METLAKLDLRLNFPVTRSSRKSPSLFAMTDEVRAADPFPLIERLPKGAALIFRHYAHPSRAELAARVVSASRQAGLRCLIAGDAEIARKCGADGLHLPEYQVLQPRYFGFRPKNWLITGAAHTVKSMRRAEKLGLDAVLISPVFPTASHPGGKALGLMNFARLCHDTTAPVIALGGINSEQARRLRLAGAAGLAGISLFSAP